MSLSELFGWMAAGLTLLTFAVRDPRTARLLALCANGCFVTYAATGGPLHVLALHLTLVPINLQRLAAIHREHRAARA